MRQQPTASALSRLAVAAILLTGLAPSLAAQQDDGALTTLRQVRQSLVEAGPRRATFVQTYVPAGFSSGETERGELAIALPDCLRFDYTEPYPKSFLLCGETAHYWNPEDGTGRRYTIDREEEPGLDLVLLGIDEIEARYRLEGETTEAGLRTIHLEPRREAIAIVHATLLIDPETRRLVGLSYEDAEGNLTRFEISGYAPLDAGERFVPPDGIAWREE